MTVEIILGIAVGLLAITAIYQNKRINQISVHLNQTITALAHTQKQLSKHAGVQLDQLKREGDRGEIGRGVTG